MTITVSSDSTPERGTRIITLTFKDEDGTTIPVNNLISPTWTLTTKKHRVIVNSRSAVVLTTAYVVLTGADLAIVDNDLWRILTVETQYNSATYGNNLNLRSQYEFSIEDLDKVE